jgi:hypothetical protein
MVFSGGAVVRFLGFVDGWEKSEVGIPTVD